MVTAGSRVAVATVVVVARGIDMARRKDLWRAHADNQVILARRTLRDFTKKFAKDPLRALEWSLPVFDAVAVLNTWEQVFRLKEQKLSMDTIISNLLDHIQTKVTNLPRSASPLASLIEQCKLRADGLALEALRADVASGKR